MYCLTMQCTAYACARLKVDMPSPWVGGWVGGLKNKKALSRDQNINLLRNFGFDSTFLPHMHLCSTMCYDDRNGRVLPHHANITQQGSCMWLCPTWS